MSEIKFRALNEFINLVGQIEEIAMMDLRKHAGEILTQVTLGKTFLIKRNSKPIAFLSYLPKVGEPNVEIILDIQKNGLIKYKL